MDAYNFNRLEVVKSIKRPNWQQYWVKSFLVEIRTMKGDTIVIKNSGHKFSHVLIDKIRWGNYGDTLIFRNIETTPASNVDQHVVRIGHPYEIFWFDSIFIRNGKASNNKFGYMLDGLKCHMASRKKLTEEHLFSKKT